MTNNYPDKVLIEARDQSIQLEGLAVAELERNLDRYLEPNWRANRMVKDWGDYVDANGKMGDDPYFNMRAVFSETQGRSHRVASDVLASVTRKQSYDMSNTIFGNYMKLDKKIDGPTVLSGEDDDMSSDEWQKIINGAVRSLRVNGWWKSKIMVPAKIVASLKAKMEKQMTAEHKDKVQLAYEGKPGAPMQIKVNSAYAAGMEEMYEVASDPMLLSIVQQYMGVPPIFNTPIGFLNSFVTGKDAKSHNKALSDTAQLYHHDMHRLGFVKVFVYLTDVDEGSGPHTLVQKTHRTRPDHLWDDGRHSDEAIAKAGLAGDEVRILGKAGTVFLVDTSCLHKGSHPETKARLIAQVQYCNSLFGKPIANSDHKVELVQRSNKDSDHEIAALVRKYVDRGGVRFMQNYI